MSIERSDLETMDPQGVVDDASHLLLSTQGRRLAGFMAATLERHYPGWRWGITVDELLDDLYNGGNFDWKLILVAGGEILERYGQPRKAKCADWQSLCKWLNGLAVPDVSDKKRGLIKHFEKRAGAESV